MNILVFLTPKSKLKYITSDMSIRQVLEIFEHYRYTNLPLIDVDGKYIKSISEGDLLYYIKNNLHFNINSYNSINILEVPTYRSYEAISISENPKELIVKVMDQNFVPVVDDSNTFIGMITRRSVIEHLNRLNEIN